MMKKLSLSFLELINNSNKLIISPYHHITKAAKTVVQALILSKLDYCNSLLVGTPECHLPHLQYIQNMVCNVVCNLKKYDHVSASMNSLHWLRVREHITYKIAYLVHCCKIGTAPQYLIDVLPMDTHNCSLRSSTSLTYNQPNVGPA